MERVKRMSYEMSKASLWAALDKEFSLDLSGLHYDMRVLDQVTRVLGWGPLTEGTEIIMGGLFQAFPISQSS